MSAEHEGSQVDPRVLQALERTLLAWLRTGIGLISFGFVIARLGAFLRVEGAADTLPGAGLLGALFGVLGVAAEALGITRYLTLRRALLQGRPFPLGHALVLGCALGVAALGALLGALVVVHEWG